MVVTGSGGYTLHCTGCGACLELTAGEVRDPFRNATRKQSMTQLHVDCDGYGDEQKARAAMKRQRSAVRKLIAKETGA